MRLSLIIIALFWFGQTFGQINASPPNPRLQKLTKPESTLQWMTLKEDVNLAPDEFITDKNLLELNADDELIEISTYTDELGYEHRRYLQHYKGIPIEHAQYIVHAKNGKTRTANGRLAKGLKLDTRSVITQENALDRIVDSSKSQKYAWKDAQVEENFKKMTNDPDATFYPKGELLIIKRAENTSSEDYVLAYRFEVFSLEPYEVKAIYVDAKNGATIKTEDLLHNAHECTAHAEDNAPATGVSNYSGTVQFNTELNDGQYRLRSNTGQTFNAENAHDYSSVDFTDSDNHWIGVSSAVDAHWGIEKAYDYFLDKHNRDSYDNNGSPVAAWVHFGNNSNMAAWNNICSCMILGDGDGEDFGSMTSLDIIGHEYAHGVTRYTSGLRYYGESGALNESFSDIFGALIEHQYHPNGGNWIVGDEVVTQSGKQGMRNMANPKDPNMISPQPDTYQGENWYDGPLDNGGIHTNSGVHNYWFYLLANGGSGVNDNGDYYSLEGIGVEKAAQIAYRNLTTYLPPNATYEDAMHGAVDAARDLYGTQEMNETYRAWCAVGLGLSNCVHFMPSGRIRDSLALVALYNSTQGNTWSYRWNLNNPISTWKGVTLNADGCVQKLSLPNRRMKGELPPEIGNLLDLDFLSLYGNNNIGGNIPAEIANLSKLKTLTLSKNNFTGNIPEGIGKLINLTSLALNHNNLTGNVPASFANFSKLRALVLNDNQLENLPYLPDIYTSLVYTFGLRNNHFTFEDILHNVEQNPSGSYAFHYDNQKKIGETKTVQLTPNESYTIKLNIDTYVEDNVYKWYKGGVLVGTTNKDEFTISNFSSTKAGVYTCQVTNSGASSLTLESYPVTIEVSPISCAMRDSLALVALYNATNGQAWYHTARWNLDQPMNTWYGITFNEEGCVTEISIEGMRLRGYFPPEIGNLLSLEKLEISGLNHDFSGSSIPLEIGKLTNLHWLDLYNNQLSGAIPPEMGNLVNLTYLSLGRNNLTNSIPPELGNLTNVRWLSLYYNQLEGEIPVELSNLASIKVLILSENKLSNLPMLSHLSPNHVALSNNHLTFKDILPNLGIMKYNQAGGSNGGSYKSQLPIGEATTYTVSAGDKVYIDLDIDKDITDNIYKWYKGGSLIQTIIGNPTFSKTIQNATDAGVYTCQVTNPGEDYLTLYSEEYTVQFEAETPVYPGDFNNDGKVDGTDPLFWGLTYGRTGISRPDASLDWTPQPCLNWNISYLNVNGKHQDANGDGIVDEADLDAINLNYSQSASGQDFNTQNAPLSLHYEIVSSEENTAGDIVHTIDVSLVNNVNDAPISIHGLSFGFDFVSDNMNYLSSEIDLSNSWLGDEDSLTVVRQNYPDENRAAYTITRSDLDDRTASTLNPIIQLVIIADDFQTGDELDFILNFNEIKASSASDGNIMSIDAGGSSPRVAQETTLIIENIYPNPTYVTQGINLTLNTDMDYGEGYIMVTDILGKTLMQQPVYLKQGEQELHVLIDKLQSGIYTVHLRGSDWHSQAQQFIITSD